MLSEIWVFLVGNVFNTIVNRKCKVFCGFCLYGLVHCQCSSSGFGKIHPHDASAFLVLCCIVVVQGVIYWFNHNFCIVKFWYVDIRTIRGGVCSTDNFLSLIFKVWDMLNYRSGVLIQSKEWCFMLTYTFLLFFFVFHQENCILFLFYLFIYYFDEAANFCKRILTN